MKKEMYEWDVQYSETKTQGTRTSFQCGTAAVYAEDEDEVRAIMAAEAPGMTVDKIIRGKLIDIDDDE